MFGNSTGGMFAQTVGCTYPELIKGIMNVIGMQALGFSCTPGKPVNFTIYGALEMIPRYLQLIFEAQMVIFMNL